MMGIAHVEVDCHELQGVICSICSFSHVLCMHKTLYTSVFLFNAHVSLIIDF